VIGGKQPIYIRMREGRPFVFAGLWDRWNEQETFTIITTTPNELCSKVHDRMPVILKEPDFSMWINPETPIEEVGSLIQSYAADEMECYPVSSLVNSPRTDSETLIQRTEVVPAPIHPKASPPPRLQQQSLP